MEINFFHVLYKYIFKHNKMKIIIILLFFNLFCVKTQQPYNSFFLEEFPMVVIIYDSQMSFYIDNLYNNLNIYTFTNEQKILSSEEAEMISIGSFYSSFYKLVYIIVKNYLYNFLYNGKSNGYVKIESITERISDLIPYKCITQLFSSFCFIFIAFINSENKLKINQISHDLAFNKYTYINSNTFDLINSSGGNSGSKCDNVSCKLMELKSKEKILACFYENEYSQIGALLIYPDTLQRYNSKIPSIKQNSGAINIKSVLFSSKQKAFVCYVNDNRNIACIIYDIVENKWGNEYKYIEKINSPPRYFNIDYFSQTDEYMLSCLSSTNEFEFSFFDNKMSIVDSDYNYTYCLSNNTIISCPNDTLPIITRYFEYDSYELAIRCDSDDFELEYISTNCSKYYEKEEIIVNEISIPMITTTLLTSLIDSSTIPLISELISPDNSEKALKKEENNTLDDILKDLNSIIKKVNNNSIYENKEEDYIIKISPINYDNFELSSTYINFSNCEDSLRKKYNLPHEAMLTVAMIEIEKNDDKAATSQVEYEVYYEGKKLDLSVCRNDKIEINYDISNNTVLNIPLISKFSDLGIDILDSKHEFFIDICYPYSENNSDMILRDRILKIYQNYSICEDLCNYEKINLDSKIITCKCNVKTKAESSIRPLRFDNIILDLITNSSFGVVKCYNLVFNFKTKLNNIGFWIFSIVIIIHFPLIIHYFIYGITPISKYIINEMKKYNYFRNQENPIKRGRKKISMDSKIYHVNFKDLGINTNIHEKKIININNKNNENEIKHKPLKTNLNNLIDNPDIKVLSSSILGIDISNRKINNEKTGKKFLSTQGINKKSQHIEKFSNSEDKTLSNEYLLIQINANNSKNNTPLESKLLLDNYDYEDAIKYDKRSFLRIYYICILSKENILNFFLIKSPLELRSLRLIIIIFIYSCDFALNTVFYFNDNISDKFYYEGNNLYLFTTFNNFFISFLSIILSFSLVNSLQIFTNSKDSIENLFRIEEKKMRKNIKYKVSLKRKKEILKAIIKINKKLKIKIIIFIILELLIMLFFYYFVTAFCEVYSNTQISWIIDSFVSFLLSFPLEFIYALIIAVFYKISIQFKLRWLYKIIMIFYSLG